MADVEQLNLLFTQLAPGGELGQVRALSRPVVYHCLERLEHEGKVTAARIERGGRGPHRVIYEPTARGRDELEAWLAAPVERVRELRPLFLLKVVLARRLELEAGPLLVAQRALLVPLAALLEAQLDEADPDPLSAERALLGSSLETVCSTLRSIDGLLSPRSRRGRRSGRPARWSAGPAVECAPLASFFLAQLGMRSSVGARRTVITALPKL